MYTWAAYACQWLGRCFGYCKGSSAEDPIEEPLLNRHLIARVVFLQIDEEELLQIRLEAKDDLKSAYAMLNERYSAPAEKAMSLDELSELEGSGGATAAKKSGSLKGSDIGSEIGGPAHAFVKPAKLLTSVCPPFSPPTHAGETNLVTLSNRLCTEERMNTHR